MGLIVLRDGKVLLARSGNEPEKYRWDLPGGFIEQGESAEEAVVREGREETGMDLRVTRFMGSVPDATDLDGAKVPTLNLCFMTEIVSGDPRPQFALNSCTEGNNQVMIGEENYFLSGDGMLMPAKKNQAPPDLRYFKQTRK